MKKEVRLLDRGLFEKAFYGFKGTYKRAVSTKRDCLWTFDRTTGVDLNC